MREAKLTERQIQVRMDRNLRDAVDDRRRNEPDLPTRPEMIRRLLKLAFTTLTAQIPASEITDLADARNAHHASSNEQAPQLRATALAATSVKGSTTDASHIWSARRNQGG